MRSAYTSHAFVWTSLVSFKCAGRNSPGLKIFKRVYLMAKDTLIYMFPSNVFLYKRYSGMATFVHLRYMFLFNKT